MTDVATAAAACGFEEYVVDAGWYTTYGEGVEELNWADRTGDWIADSTKFPRGVGPVMAHVDSLGMRPGLWISLTSAHPKSRVYREHPEWFIEDAAGEHTNLHNPENEIRTACFGTGWYDYIRDVIAGYVADYDLKYVKLDLSIVTSAYIHDPAQSGCYATDHPHHRDRAESFGVLYDRLFRLFDTLHAVEPELFIDCTFETAGKLQLFDYAFARHAEGDWLSNIEDPQPYGALRARHLAWSRVAALPATALAIGNQSLDDARFELAIQSMLGSLPLLLGDPRDYSPAKRDAIRAWADWTRAMEDRYRFLDFRQDVAGFGEPNAEGWDAFARVNTETADGGVVGVFRNGSAEEQRRVTLAGLDAAATYVVADAPGGEVVHTATGAQLMGEGFGARLPEAWTGRVYEVRRE